MSKKVENEDEELEEAEDGIIVTNSAPQQNLVAQISTPKKEEDKGKINTPKKEEDKEKTSDSSGRNTTRKTEEQTPPVTPRDNDKGQGQTTTEQPTPPPAQNLSKGGNSTITTTTDNSSPVNSPRRDNTDQPTTPPIPKQDDNPLETPRGEESEQQEKSSNPETPNNNPTPDRTSEDNNDKNPIINERPENIEASTIQQSTQVVDNTTTERPMDPSSTVVSEIIISSTQEEVTQDTPESTTPRVPNNEPQDLNQQNITDPNKEIQNNEQANQVTTSKNPKLNNLVDQYYDILGNKLEEKVTKKSSATLGGRVNKTTSKTYTNLNENEQTSRAEALKKRAIVLERMDDNYRSDMNEGKDPNHEEKIKQRQQAAAEASKNFHENVLEQHRDSNGNNDFQKLTVSTKQQETGTINLAGVDFATKGKQIEFPADLGQGKEASFTASFAFVDENGKNMKKSEAVYFGVTYENGKITNIHMPGGLKAEQAEGPNKGNAYIEKDGKRYYAKASFATIKTLQTAVGENLKQEIEVEKAKEAEPANKQQTQNLADQQPTTPASEPEQKPAAENSNKPILTPPPLPPRPTVPPLDLSSINEKTNATEEAEQPTPPASPEGAPPPSYEESKNHQTIKTGNNTKGKASSLFSAAAKEAENNVKTLNYSKMGGNNPSEVNNTPPNTQDNTKTVKVASKNGQNPNGLVSDDKQPLGKATVTKGSSVSHYHEISKPDNNALETPQYTPQNNAKPILSKEKQKKINKDFLNRAMEGNIAQMEKALDAGADLNAQGETHGNSALHKAVERHHPEAVTWLLKKGIDINLKNKKGKTAENILNDEYEKDHKRNRNKGNILTTELNTLNTMSKAFSNASLSKPNRLSSSSSNSLTGDDFEYFGTPRQNTTDPYSIDIDTPRSDSPNLENYKKPGINNSDNETVGQNTKKNAWGVNEQTENAEKPRPNSERITSKNKIPNSTEFADNMRRNSFGGGSSSRPNSGSFGPPQSPNAKTNDEKKGKKGGKVNER